MLTDERPIDWPIAKYSIHSNLWENWDYLLKKKSNMDAICGQI